MPPTNFYEIVAAFAVALVLTVFFSVIRSRGPWGALWLVFIVIFLAAWAAHLWINPFGPMIFGVSVVPIFIVGLIFAFVLAATAAQPVAAPVSQQGAEESEVASTAIGVFFWVLLILLVAAIAIGYYRLPVENTKQLVH